MHARLVAGHSSQLERRDHQTRHLDALLDTQIQVLLDAMSVFHQHLVLGLHFLQGDRNQLVLPLLSFDLFLLVRLLLRKIVDEGVESLRLGFRLVLQLQQVVELRLVPLKLLLHLDDSVIVVELALLLFRLVLQML